MNNISFRQIAIIVAVIIVAVGGLYLIKIPKMPVAISSPTPTDSALPTASLLPGETPEPTPNAIVSWRGDGVKLPDLKIVTGYRDDLDDYAPSDPLGTEYYDMGSHGSNTVILAMVPAQDLGGPSLFLFEKNSQGYVLMQAMSAMPYTTQSKQGYTLSSSVIATDTTTLYNAIRQPKELAYRGLVLSGSYNTFVLFSDYLKDSTGRDITLTKLDHVSAGDLYLEQQQRTNYFLLRYILKLPSGLYATYTPQYDFFNDNYTANITWTDGSKSTDPYGRANFGGCGNYGTDVTPISDISNAITQSGTTNKGEQIYEFKDIHNPILQDFYTLADNGGQYQPDGQYIHLSLQDWASHHPVIIYRNAVGKYVIFTNSKYGPQAECGKPVIYLYPTQTENVSVQVGADITKSEPVYQNGWQVVAQPDGTLTMTDGTSYDSLFWEGTGRGEYPSITEGTIVAQADIEATLRKQLGQLGLNQKESSDFMEFWLPKMPATPYVRLTWFTTSQMNHLAPLFVSPRPDTTIRVFLDFAGLEKPFALPVQHLSSIPRSGFTLIEWGGILR